MSITAAAWVERATVAPEVFERWPDYRVVLVAADALDRDALAAAVHEWFGAAVAEARAAAGEFDPHIDRWHQAFRDFGVKPRVARNSADALIRRAASDNGLPTITPLVDAYNAVSVRWRVPIGGEDLDRYSGAPRLVIATGGEPFVVRADGDEVTDHPEPGEPVWVDDIGVTCRRWNWRQTIRTAIGDGTTRVGFIVDSLDAPEHAGADAAAQALASLLRDPEVRVIEATGSV